MAQNKVVKVVHFFEGILREQGLHIQKTVVFGSHAEGKITDESDLDIAVISEDFRGKDIFERAKLTKKAEIDTIKKFMIPLDIVTLDPEEFNSETSIIAEYIKEGKVLIG